mmetsp:Transcript_5555/g.12249  ORF Transcript_5555/g.12249 Transcript_5555/m.12249 type:complete len:290 (-) Transcript_5555:47-916(-)
MAAELLSHPAAVGCSFFPRNEPRELPSDAKSFRVKCSHGGVLDCILLSPSVRGSKTLVHWHGNGELSVALLSEGPSPNFPRLVDVWRRAGLEVLLVEYHGYQNSTGKPSLGDISGDCEAIYAALGNLGRTEGAVIASGRSLGSLFAIHYASKFPVAGLIVESGIASYPELIRARPTQLGELESSLDDLCAAIEAVACQQTKLGEVGCPLLVLHTADDDIVPVSHAQRILEWAVSPTKHFVQMDHGGHNYIFPLNHERYSQELEQFIKLCGHTVPDTDPTSTSKRRCVVS